MQCYETIHRGGGSPPYIPLFIHPPTQRCIVFPPSMFCSITRVLLVVGACLPTLAEGRREHLHIRRALFSQEDGTTLYHLPSGKSASQDVTVCISEFASGSKCRGHFDRQTRDDPNPPPERDLCMTVPGIRECDYVYNHSNYVSLLRQLFNTTCKSVCGGCCESVDGDAPDLAMICGEEVHGENVVRGVCVVFIFAMVCGCFVCSCTRRREEIND